MSWADHPGTVVDAAAPAGVVCGQLTDQAQGYEGKIPLNDRESGWIGSAERECGLAQAAPSGRLATGAEGSSTVHAGC